MSDVFIIAMVMGILVFAFLVVVLYKVRHTNEAFTQDDDQLTRWMRTDGMPTTPTPDERAVTSPAPRVPPGAAAGLTDPVVEPEEPKPEPKRGSRNSLASTIGRHTGSLLVRRIGSSAIPVWALLVWVLAGYIAAEAHWTAVSWKWPPRESLQNDGSLPARPKLRLGKHLTAKEKRQKVAQYKKARRTYPQRFKAALRKHQQTHSIPVWALIFGLPLAVLLINTMSRLREQEWRARMEDFFPR